MAHVFLYEVSHQPEGVEHVTWIKRDYSRCVLIWSITPVREVEHVALMKEIIADVFLYEASHHPEGVEHVTWMKRDYSRCVFIWSITPARGSRACNMNEKRL